MKAVLALVVVLAAVSVSAWQRDTHWERTGSAPDEALMRLSVALKMRNVKALHDAVKAVSDPRRAGSTYAKYWSSERIAHEFAPHAHDAEAVAAYFRNAGAARVELTAARDFLVVDMPVSALEQAIGLDVFQWTHRASGRVVYRTAEHAHERWPREVRDRTDIITGVSDMIDYPHERKAMKHVLKAQAKALAASQGACTSSAPDFEGRILGGSGDIGVQMTLYCSNGQPSTNLQSPCADFPPAVSAVTLNVQPLGPHAAQNVTAPISALQCKMRGGAVFCIFPTVYVPQYSRLQITAQTTYADGSQSEVATYPTAFSTSSYSTPQAIFERYGVPDGTRGTHPKNSQSVTAFELQFIDVDGDLMQFFDAMGLARQQPVIVGQNNQSIPGGESTLDIQYVMGVGAGVPTMFWSVTGPGPAVPPGQGAYILEWALQIGNTSDADVPLVTSISYGDTESGYYWKFGNYAYIYRTDQELAKMALRGMTVIAGSGDAGCSNVGEAGNDISPTDPTCTPFRAFYPSNSQYVTSASSTFATTAATPVCRNGALAGNEPVVCDKVGEVAVGVAQGLFWTTGGGFSNMSTNPVAEWQADAVAEYLENNAALLPPSEFWNSGGRAYPDVSTLGHNELCVVSGDITPVDGTSASGPVLAGLMSLLNDQRLHAGLPPMGLLNPFLYQSAAANSAAFHDVTVGNNNDGDIQPRCSAFPTACQYGFSTAPGWDPVTGLGTPNWPVLVQLALQWNPSLFH